MIRGSLTPNAIEHYIAVLIILLDEGCFCTELPHIHVVGHSGMEIELSIYRSGTLNSNMVNSKFHLIRSFFQILARILSFHV